MKKIKRAGSHEVVALQKEKEIKFFKEYDIKHKTYSKVLLLLIFLIYLYYNL